eukprot:264348-Rhodomonas_salina.2
MCVVGSQAESSPRWRRELVSGAPQLLSLRQQREEDSITAVLEHSLLQAVVPAYALVRTDLRRTVVPAGAAVPALPRSGDQPRGTVSAICCAPTMRCPVLTYGMLPPGGAGPLGWAAA